jgi:hypothetical protein
MNERRVNFALQDEALPVNCQQCTEFFSESEQIYDQNCPIGSVMHCRVL